MKLSFKKATLAIAAAALISSMAAASTITLDADPTMIPDETAPRVGVGNPAGFASDCWKGPATNKTNFYLHYLQYLATEFPNDAATMTVNNIDELSYWTNRAIGTPGTRDWYIVIYTRPTGSSDCAGWYHERWIGGYSSHSTTNVWTNYTTADNSLKFQRFCGSTLEAEQTLAQMKTAIGTQQILAISTQTDSGWGGFDGLLDGMVVKHTNGNVGRTNFGNTFLPASNAWSIGILVLAMSALLAFFVVRRQTSAA